MAGRIGEIGRLLLNANDFVAESQVEGGGAKKTATAQTRMRRTAMERRAWYTGDLWEM